MNPDDPRRYWTLETETNQWHVLNGKPLNPRVALCGFKPKLDTTWAQHDQLQSTDRCERCLAVIASA